MVDKFLDIFIYTKRKKKKKKNENNYKQFIRRFKNVTFIF